MTAMRDHDVLETYWLAVCDARLELSRGDAVQALIDVDADPALVHGFMVQFAALAVQLQEPVEQLLVAASHRCEHVGEWGLARTLLGLAEDAIERYRLFADDTRVLAQLWNDRRLPELDLTWLLTQPTTASMRRIWAFHGELVSSSAPWAYLATIYEIDALVAAIAPMATVHAERLLGSEIRSGMRSFACLARAGEQGRARAAMREVLRQHPERLDTVTRAARRMLQHYGEFLDDCMVAAVNLASWRQLAHG